MVMARDYRGDSGHCQSNLMAKTLAILMATFLIIVMAFVKVMRMVRAMVMFTEVEMVE